MKANLIIVVFLWLIVSCAEFDFATIEFGDTDFGPFSSLDTIYVVDQKSNQRSRIFSATITGSKLESVHFFKSVNGGEKILLNSNLVSSEYDYQTWAISSGLVKVDFYYADIFYDSGDVIRFEVKADNDGQLTYAERFVVVQ